jgi:hypothetical protein
VKRRYRYSLRLECGEALRGLAEPALVKLAERIPGATLSRTDHDDHGDHLMKTGRVVLVKR